MPEGKGHHLGHTGHDTESQSDLAKTGRSQSSAVQCASWMRGDCNPEGVSHQADPTGGSGRLLLLLAVCADAAKQAGRVEPFCCSMSHE
eukprot:6403617-Amphidinium_carterae.2